jgi:phosphoribosylglycinamide formyltransferase-1
MTGPGRVVVLATPGRSTNAVVNRLAEHFADVRLVLEEPEGRWLFVRRRARRLGWRKVIGQLAFIAGCAPVLERLGATRVAEIAAEHGLSFATPTVETTRITSVNDPSTAALVASLEPDAVVLNGTRIVTGTALEGFGVITLNIHAGITPAYRGVHGGYWALAHDDPDRCGVTLYVVDPGVDTGPVVGQARVHPTVRDGYATLPALQVATALPMLVAALTRLVEGHTLPAVPAGGESRQWYHPTIWEYARHRIRRGLR